MPRQQVPDSAISWCRHSSPCKPETNHLYYIGCNIYSRYHPDRTRSHYRTLHLCPLQDHKRTCGSQFARLLPGPAGPHTSPRCPYLYNHIEMDWNQGYMTLHLLQLNAMNNFYLRRRSGTKAFLPCQETNRNIFRPHFQTGSGNPRKKCFAAPYHRCRRYQSRRRPLSQEQVGQSVRQGQNISGK